jgi:hypothetical protein
MAFFTVFGTSAGFHIREQLTKMCQIGIPYFRAKANDFFERLGGGLSSDAFEEGLVAGQLQDQSDHVRRTFSDFYSVLTLSYRRSKATSDVCSKQYTHMRTWLSSCGY